MWNLTGQEVLTHHFKYKGVYLNAIVRYKTEVDTCIMEPERTVEMFMGFLKTLNRDLNYKFPGVKQYYRYF